MPPHLSPDGMKLRNILLDRDGTLIKECNYLHDPDRVMLLPGAARALLTLQRAGCRLFLVTNQSGIGRGYFPEADYHAVQDRLAELLAAHGVHIEDTLFCPHTPDAGCSCRKPRTGMWTELVNRHGLRPGESIMIGDKLADIGFARNAGLAAAVLVLTGHGEKERIKLSEHPDAAPDFIAPNLELTARWLAARFSLG